MIVISIFMNYSHCFSFSKTAKGIIEDFKPGLQAGKHNNKWLFIIEKKCENKDFSHSKCLILLINFFLFVVQEQNKGL